MPSSKKNRGKQRKANREAKKQQQPQAAATPPARAEDDDVPRAPTAMMAASLPFMFGSQKCNHGFPDLPMGHVIFHAYEAYLGTWIVTLASGCSGSVNDDYESHKNAVNDVFSKFPQVFDNAEALLMLRAVMLSMGTKDLLDSEEGKSPRLTLEQAKAHAALVTLVEHRRNVLLNFSSGMKPVKETRDVVALGNRKKYVTRFFGKRIPCDCLDCFYLEVKNETKMGNCFSCRKCMEYKKLLVCSRCKIFHYCSKECQLEAWPKHKWVCNIASA